MKKCFLFLIFFISFNSLFAQQTWQEATKIADSLQLQFKFDKVISYRNIAIDKASTTQKDTLSFLKLLKKISLEELNVSDEKFRKASYKNLQTQVKELELIGAKPERLYQAYRRLYIFAHNYMRSMEDTEVYIKKSIEHHFKCKKIDSLTLLKTMHSSGVISRELGLFKNAVTTFNNAEMFYNTLKVKDTNMLGSIYSDLANTYHSKFLNIPKKRLEYLKKSESVFLQLKNPNYDYLISLYSRFSDYEKNIGNYENAISYLKKGLKIHFLNKEKAQDSRMGKIGYKRELQFYHYLVQIYSQTNNEEELHTQLNEMLKIKTDAKKLDAIETDFISLAYLFTSRYYRKKEDFSTALSFINKGLTLNKKKHEEYLEPDFLLEKVKAFTVIKKYNEAEHLIKEIEKLENNPAFIEKDIIQSASILFLKQNKKEQAYNYLDKAISWLNKQNKGFNLKEISYKEYVSSPVLNDANLLINLAINLEESNLNMPKDVETLYWLALKQFKDNFENQFLNDALNKTYNQINTYFLKKIANEELSEVQINRFISFTENIDSKFSLKKFHENNYISSSKSDSLINKEQFIRSSITFLKKKNLRKKSDSIKQLIFEENLKLKSTLKELKSFNESYVHLSTNESYKENLNALKNDYIIKYKAIDNQLFRIVFHRDDIEVSIINDYTSLKKSVETYLLMIKNINTPIATIKKSASVLYKTLLKDIDLSNSPKIYIIPDAVLYYLPFELLVENENYLIESKDISYASSLTFLQIPTTTSTKNNDIALFAPSYKMYKPNELQLAVRGEPYSLSGAIEEVKSISEIYKSTLFLNDQATKQAFQKLSNKYAVIHLSMHSFLNDEDSELNSLVFSDSSDDYEMHISELYGLHLNADLVVLSACNTGVGDVKTGKGVVSMNTTFTYAGVPSTVSSLWSAPDQSTKEIMVDFYKNLKQKQTISLSLKNAKLKYLKTTEDAQLKHPYYWAGFVLYGNDTIIQLNSDTNYLKWIGIAIILAIMVFLFIRKRKKLI